MIGIVQRLRDRAEDPMWAAHAEVRKDLLFEAAREIERLQGLVLVRTASPQTPGTSGFIRERGAWPFPKGGKK